MRLFFLRFFYPEQKNPNFFASISDVKGGRKSRIRGPSLLPLLLSSLYPTAEAFPKRRKEIKTSPPPTRGERRGRWNRPNRHEEEREREKETPKTFTLPRGRGGSEAADEKAPPTLSSRTEAEVFWSRRLGKRKEGKGEEVGLVDGCVMLLEIGKGGGGRKRKEKEGGRRGKAIFSPGKKVLTYVLWRSVWTYTYDGTKSDMGKVPDLYTYPFPLRDNTTSRG